MRGKKRDHFPSQELIATTSWDVNINRPSMAWKREKNNPQTRTPDWSVTGGVYGGSSHKTPKSRGEGGDKRHPQPNTPKQPNITKYEIFGPHSSTLLLDNSTAWTQLSIGTNHNESNVIVPIIAEEEFANINHDPKILTGIQLEEETVTDFRRHPSLEGKAVIKGSYDQIRPNGM